MNPMAAFKIALWVVAVFSAALGVWLVKKPRKAIEFQIGFYRLINWKMEPLDWDREILNTSIMGAAALLCGAVTIGLLLIRSLPPR